MFATCARVGERFSVVGRAVNRFRRAICSNGVISPTGGPHDGLDTTIPADRTGLPVTVGHPVATRTDRALRWTHRGRIDSACT